MSVTFGSGELGEIVGGSRRVQLTWDDLLWAGRMLKGETGAEGGTVHGAAVLWCMASRMIQSGLRSYTRMIQAYSQPINPKWRADGEFCRIGGRYHGQDNCSPRRLEDREALSTLPWERLPSEIQDLVFRWATGQVDNPIPKAVHFAVPAVTTSGARRAVGDGGDDNWQFVWDSKGRTSIDPTSRGGNTFVSTNRSRGWDPRFVKVVFQSREASDSTVEAVSAVEGAPSSDRSRPLAEAAPRSEPPTNNILERISAITSDRTSPPLEPKYEYFQAFGDFEDPRAQNQLSQEESDTLLKVNSSRFYEQISNLKTMSSLAMTRIVPTLQISTVDEKGDYVNLNEKIFAISPFEQERDEKLFGDFPERPLASLKSFEVVIQELSVGGVMGIQMGTLSLKIHNPRNVSRRHPVGKYIAYMMSQGFVMRIKYGVAGGYDMGEAARKAFQWREEDFYVTSYSATIGTDQTMDLTISVMPATHRLLNQLHVGQSIPTSSIGAISAQDVDDIVNSVASNDPDATEQQTRELRRRLTLFVNQLNSARTSPAVGFEDRGNDTFGLQLHAALTNNEIFELDDSASPIPVNNMVEALQTVQAVVLTRRFEQILRDDCYQYEHRGTITNVVNIGPLIFNLIKPEIDFTFATVARNQIEIGEKFSSDSSDDAPNESVRNRTNVKLIFGNFNSKAGQWANKPISVFPVNVESIFSHLRQRRSIGEFSSTINQFIMKINESVHEIENYDADTSTGSSDTPIEIQPGEIKYYIYPDPLDETSWIVYVFDNKVSTVQISNIIQSLATDTPPTEDELKTMLAENDIPWIEMGEQGSFIKQLSAQTTADDLISSNAMLMAYRNSSTVRNMDASVTIPTGLSREFFASSQNDSQNVIRATQYVPPMTINLQAFVLVTAYYLGPIFLFAPIRNFSGIYLMQEVRHDVKKEGCISNINLRVNTSRYNNIAV